jgi:uncharacterized lipoprotein YddW (UPF0748 family)
MRLNRLFIFFIAAFCLSGFAVPAQMVRAVWVRPFIGADVSTRKNHERGRAFIRRELERIKRAGLNTIYLETFWNGYAIYPTGITGQRPLSLDSGIADENGNGWDALQTYLEEAGKLDLEIHAWVHVFHQWSSHLGSLERSPIFSRHPEWAMLDQTSAPLVKSEAEGANRDIYKTFMSPSNKKVRLFLQRLVTELAVKYPQLAGIQWDYVRYPLHDAAQSFDYNPDALKQFQKETGIDARTISCEKDAANCQAWQRWKTRQVTAVVRELGAIVRKKRPRWVISAAVFPDIAENLRLKQQDWKTWSQKGYVDALLPMLYSPDLNRVESWAKEFRAQVSTRTKIYPALFINHFYGARDKKLNARFLQLSENFNFDGFGLFAAQSLTDDLIEKLAGRN